MHKSAKARINRIMQSVRDEEKDTIMEEGSSILENQIEGKAEELNTGVQEYQEFENPDTSLNLSDKENEIICMTLDAIDVEEPSGDTNIELASKCPEPLSPRMFDYSSGSSDDYIPNTSTDDSSDNSLSSRLRPRPNKCLRKNIRISESSSDTSVVQPEPGPSCSGANLYKKRKSAKERRADRQERLFLRNSGKSYVTKLGKLKHGRTLAPLTDCRMKCNNRIPHNIREVIFKEYWLLGSYDERAKYTERLIKINKKKTHTLGAKLKREYSNTYKIIHFSDEYKICKGCLLKTLGESNRFLQTVCEKIIKYGRVLKSEKGRAASYKKISEARLKEVEEHINKFPAYESHYSRAKSSRKYLSADLCIVKMYQLYCDENSNPVSKSVYAKVFQDMNLSFKKPSIDTCNKCNQLQNKLKYTKEAEEITNLQELLLKHQEDYENAYNEKRKDKEIAKNDNLHTCVVAFDLQQCLPTPMLNTQSAFYKRQLWVYNLTVHDFMSNNAYCYMWPESSGGRGANQIASCLYDFITVRLPLLHPTANKLIMYSDSCSGQNKNSIVSTSLLVAVKDSTQLSDIEHKFLIPGHTHMEVDSDHALIERVKKRTSMNIHHPRDWCQLVRTASNRSNKFSVIEMTEKDFYDFALFSKNNLLVKKVNDAGEKFVWSDVRVMKFTKGQFPAFEYKEKFIGDYKLMSYKKKNKDYSLVNIDAIPKCYKGPVPISTQKKKDLLSLLDYIDPGVHEFYHNLITNTHVRDVDPDIITSE